MLHDREQTLVLIMVLLLRLLLPFYSHFPGEPGSDGSSCSTCTRREPLRINGTGLFYRPNVLPASHPSASKHWGEYKALTVTRGLTSSFLHPPSDSWRKGRRSLYTDSPTTVKMWTKDDKKKWDQWQHRLTSLKWSTKDHIHTAFTTATIDKRCDFEW